jgi:hypothetical protein
MPPAQAGCADGLDAVQIMAAKCGLCHGQNSPTKGLDLVSPGLDMRLVGIRSTCFNREFLEVRPGPVQGFFLEKLEGPVDSCGVIMPFATPPLTPEEKACLYDWAGKAVARGPVVEY